MSPARRNLCVFYGVIAFVALIATWWNNIAYLADGNDLGGFVVDSYANYASSSLTNDLWLVVLAAVVFMVVEARRLGIKYVWVYVVLSFVIAISVMFPLFLIARERRMSETSGTAT
ncbi:DUF2834 domain-containing protein [Rhodococcus maanshanensis]|uniref:DUF2834 domain-containing protein n=1 Tax=Rhodococcus maanshanensis TaxID=183556 RepID=UPI0022B311B1|nr:DUF2834 domain-containing protein [Rhodococcus maanshanensis]MCZ4558945.1 DUF2834 domain-containing protein [Rhodococcus maanshanensis]